MNAPVKAITLPIGEATITVPAEVAALAYLEKLLAESRPIPFAVKSTERRVPPIGADHEGGLYAGLTVHDEDPYELVLLPGEAEKLTFEEAKKWAIDQGGVLPSRVDQLILRKNLKDRFHDAYYWSGEQPPELADYAWYQSFGDGYQDWGNVSNRYRARAVRRVSIR